MRRLFLFFAFLSFFTFTHASQEYFVKVINSSSLNISYLEGDEEIGHPLEKVIQDFAVQKITVPFVTKDFNLQHTYVFTIGPSVNTKKFQRSISKYSFIEYVEEVPKVELFYPPNDPLYNQQYALPLIDGDLAWDEITCVSNSNVVLAIIDDAVRMDHEDLMPSIWINPLEIAGNGIDDDNNGYVDDVNGWDAADNDNNPNPPANATNSYFSHGTHVAGIAAAATDNNTGVSSIGNGLRIMPIKIGANSSSSLTGAYQGVDYAIASGYVDVVNMSWGGGGYSLTYQNLFNAGNSAGITFVAAAGNSNTSAPMYPASYNHVISVAASDANDQRASFSNYGNTIDVTAPGVNILSTVPGSISSYGTKSGTSMASPLVAGLCGLMKCYNNGITPLEIENCLESTADNIDAQNPGFINDLGAGRVNALAALLCLNPVPTAMFYSNDTVVCPNQTVQFYDQSSGAQALSYSWQFPGGTPNSSTLQNPIVSYSNLGTYNVSLTVSNSFGNDLVTKNNYIVVQNPTATLSGTSSIIAGATAYLKFTFLGTPPFSVSYSDGTNNFTENGILQNPFYLGVTPSVNTTYNITSMSDAFCTGSVSGTASVNLNQASASLDCYYGNTYGNVVDVARGMVYNPINDVTYTCGFANSGLPFVMASDRDGSLLWTKTYNVTTTGFLSLLIADNGSDIIVGGNYQGDFYILRLDLNGNVIWSNKYDAGFESAIHLEHSLGDTYFAYGRINGSSDDVILVRFDGSGSVIWSYGYNETDDQNYAMAADVNGGCVIAGSLESGSYDYFVSRIDVNGNEIVSSKAVDGSDVSRVYAVLADGSDYYIAGGDFTFSGTSRHFIAKLDANLDVVWRRATSYVPNLGPYQGRMTKDNAGNFYWFTPIRNGSTNVDEMLVQFDTNGVIKKVKTSFYNSFIAAFGAQNTQSTSGNDLIWMINSNSYPSANKIGITRTDSSLTSCMLVDLTETFSNDSHTATSFNFTRYNLNCIVTPEAALVNVISGNYSELCTPNCLDSIPSFCFNTTLDTTICAEDSTQLMAGDGYDYSWSPNINISNPNIQDPVVGPITANTSFIVSYLSVDSCALFDTINLIPNSISINLEQNDTFICVVDTIFLNVTGASTNTYVWSPSGSLATTTGSSNSFYPGNGSQLVSVVGTDIYGCTAVDSIQIDILPCCGGFADIDIDDSIICVNEAATFVNASIYGNNASFAWDFGPNATPSTYIGLNPPPIIYSSPGVFPARLILSDDCGMDTAYQNVYVNDLPFYEMADDTSICGLDTFIFEIGGTEIVGNDYLWLPNIGLNNNQIANPEASVTNSITYTLRVEDEFTGCIVFDTLHINFSPPIEDFINIDQSSLCFGDTAILFVSEAYDSLYWSTGEFQQDTIQFELDQDTMIYASIFLDGCVAEDSIFIPASVTPSFTINFQDTVCANSWDTIEVVTSGIPVWEGTDTSFLFPSLINQNSTIDLSVYSGFCRIDTSINIYVVSPPNIQITGEDTVCVNTLANYSTNGGDSYLWSNGSSIMQTSYLIDQDTLIFVQVENAYCTVSDSMMVYAIDSVELQILGDSTYCIAESYLLYTSSGQNALWSNGVFSDSIVGIVLGPQEFYAEIFNNYCPNASDTISISADSIPEITLDSFLLIYEGDSTQVSVEGQANSWMWSPPEGISCLNCNDPIFFPDSSTTYVLSSEINGCVVYDSITIEVIYLDDCLVIPTAFTPNNDNINDNFKPIPLSDQLVINSFKIYNRWGEMVHAGLEPWDGRFKDIEQNIGVYVYTLDYDCKGGNKVVSGNVTLIR